ncbi:unnamed protein product [Staurois parvus]|uniref:Uncharacterized protein n=1 Tax=Staurois parvus TaxID=386267 RepID=A0ABN9AL61_9NEOB|nr:unnamed protein product [Staurois parvus]
MGKYHSPDPYQNCKQGIAIKTVTGLRDSTGSLTKSRSGILEVSRAFLKISWGRSTSTRQGCPAFWSLCQVWKTIFHPQV